MAKKRKVPKTIAGVKLPKPLRRGLRDLAASQTGRTALAEAVDAAGAALAAAQAPPTTEAKRANDNQAAAKTRPGRNRPADARAAAVQALEEAARSFTEALRRKPPPSAPTPTPAGPPPSAVTH